MVTEKAIKKTSQSTFCFFLLHDFYFTGHDLTYISLLSGWIMLDIWWKNLQGIFPLIRES